MAPEMPRTAAIIFLEQTPEVIERDANSDLPATINEKGTNPRDLHDATLASQSLLTATAVLLEEASEIVEDANSPGC